MNSLWNEAFWILKFGCNFPNLHNNIIDWNMDEFNNESKSTHQPKANGSSYTHFIELWKCDQVRQFSSEGWICNSYSCSELTHLAEKVWYSALTFERNFEESSSLGSTCQPCLQLHQSSGHPWRERRANTVHNKPKPSKFRGRSLLHYWKDEWPKMLVPSWV